VKRTFRLGALVLLAGLGVQAADPVPYPTDFRSWTFIKSGLSAARGGVHHIFANDKALEGYRTGTFPDGAMIAFDLISTKDLASLPMDGPRALVDVMTKDSAKYAQTGGWGFEEFLGDSHTNRALDAAAQQACYACHVSQKDRDHVFSMRPGNSAGD
jgi:hypothetical protein